MERLLGLRPPEESTPYFDAGLVFGLDVVPGLVVLSPSAPLGPSQMAELPPESPSLVRLGEQESEVFLGARFGPTSLASSTRPIWLMRLAGVLGTPPPLQFVIATTTLTLALRLFSVALARMASAVVRMLLSALPGDPP